MQTDPLPAKANPFHMRKNRSSHQIRELRFFTLHIQKIRAAVFPADRIFVFLQASAPNSGRYVFTRSIPVGSFARVLPTLRFTGSGCGIAITQNFSDNTHQFDQNAAGSDNAKENIFRKDTSGQENKTNREKSDGIRRIILAFYKPFQLAAEVFAHIFSSRLLIHVLSTFS